MHFYAFFCVHSEQFLWLLSTYFHQNSLILNLENPHKIEVFTFSFFFFCRNDRFKAWRKLNRLSAICGWTSHWCEKNEFPWVNYWFTFYNIDVIDTKTCQLFDEKYTKVLLFFSPSRFQVLDYEREGIIFIREYFHWHVSVKLTAES